MNRLVAGLVVVVVGALLLMNTTGYLPWTVWDAVLSFWPLLVIGLGVQIIFARYRFPGVAVAFLIILIVAAMNPYPTSPGVRLPQWFHHWLFIPQPTKSFQTYAPDLPEGVAALDLSLSAPSVVLDIKEDEALSGTLLKAELGWDRVKPRFRLAEGSDGNRASVSITAESGATSRGRDEGRQEWTLALNPSLPTNLRITGGVASLSLDASPSAIEGLYVTAGVSRLELSFGFCEGSSEVTVQGGVSDIRLTVPDGLGVRVLVSNPVFGTGDLVKQGLLREGDAWQTEGYEGARAKVLVNIDCGTGKIGLVRKELRTHTVRTTPPKVISSVSRGYYPSQSMEGGWQSAEHARRYTPVPQLLLSRTLVPDVSEMSRLCPRCFSRNLSS